MIKNKYSTFKFITYRSSFLLILLLLIQCAPLQRGINESDLLYYRVKFARVDSIKSKSKNLDKYFTTCAPGRTYIFTDQKNAFHLHDTIRMTFDIKSAVRIKYTNK